MRVLLIVVSTIVAVIVLASIGVAITSPIASPQPTPTPQIVLANGGSNFFSSESACEFNYPFVGSVDDVLTDDTEGRLVATSKHCTEVQTKIRSFWVYTSNVNF